MSSADKFEIFLKICGYAFILLLILKVFHIIIISLWVVFLPIIIPIAIIIHILSKNAG